MRTRVKICGLTRPEDAQAAIGAGADALGWVLVPASPRFIAPQHAAIMQRALPPFVQGVALLMDTDAEFVRQAIAALKPELLQFHGSESAGFCEQFGLPYVKAVAMADAPDLQAEATRYASARALLLDGHGAGEMGGSGQPFDWQAARGQLRLPLILAGGLSAANVGTAIRQARPYAVDVSSGVEQSPSVKDAEKIRKFIEEVRTADAR